MQPVSIKGIDVNVKTVTNKLKFVWVMHIQIILFVFQDVSQIVLKACCSLIRLLSDLLEGLEASLGTFRIIKDQLY